MLLTALIMLLTVNAFAGSEDEVVGNQYSIAVSMPMDCYAYADNTIVTSGIPISPTSLVTGENGLEMYISKVSVIPKNGWAITSGPDYGAKEFGITIGGKQVIRDATGSCSAAFGKAASPIVDGEIPAEIKLNYSANTDEGDASDVAEVIVYMMADSEVLTVPTQSGSLTYTGSTLTPSWTGYDATKMTMSGTTSATNVGTYTTTFEPKFGYCWSDGSMDPRNVTWSIGKAAGTLSLSKTFAVIDYNASTTTLTVTKTGEGAITATSSAPGIAAVSVSGNTVTVTKKGAGTATITVSAAGDANYNAPASKPCTITCIGSLTVPSQSGTLTYTGSSQSPKWNNYDGKNSVAKMDIGGTTSATNAGTYTATFKSASNYRWSDGTAGTKRVTWSIGKATGSLSLSQTSVTLDYKATTATFTVTRSGDGAITAISSNTDVATVSVSGTTVTVTKEGKGTATITVSAAASANYTAPADKTCAVTCVMAVPILSDQANWYKGSVAKSTITEIQLVDRYTPTGSETESWDASAKQNGSVMAYVTGTKVILAGNGSGKIVANEDSRFMFRDFSAVKQITGLNMLDTSMVTNMYGMFYGDTGLTSLDVSGFNTSKVTDMSYMFYGCNKLTSLDVSGFDTSNVTNMACMFDGCKNLTSMDVSGFDTSNVTNMYGMFRGCQSLTSLDLSGFDTSKVTDMGSMFGNCRALTSLNVSGFDTSNVTIMSHMFSGCIKLTDLDVSDFNTSKVTAMNQMFSGCSKLTSLDLSIFNTTKVTSMNYMFSSCAALTNLDLSSFDTSKVTDMGGMFSGCRALTSLNVSGFDTSNVTIMSHMFSSCIKLTDLDVSDFNTSKVTDMGFMFSDCSALTRLNVSGFDTSKVTNMSLMFGFCNALTSLDVSNFNTSSVTTMQWMFENCKALTSLNVTSFDTSKVTNMGSMFNGCSGLTTIYVSNRWSTAKVTSSDSMFSGCTSLKGAISYDSSKTDATYANYTTGYFTYKAA